MKNKYGKWVCDFCHKTEEEVKQIIVNHEASERYPAICNECIITYMFSLIQELNNE
jgi:hypothetical protein